MSSTWQAIASPLPSSLHTRKARRRPRDLAEGDPEDTLDLTGPDLTSPPNLDLPASRRRTRFGFSLAIAGALTAFAVHSGRDSMPGALRALLPGGDSLARAMGLGIDQITLSGHRFTYDGDIFDALDLGNVRSFASLDAKAAKMRIERVPWVATAELTRVYPNRLDIRITERKPFALWSRGGRHFLIDETGRVLSPLDGKDMPDLPRVAGEGAAKTAKGLLELVGRYPEISRRLTEAERVGERRWNLKLTDGVVLKIPPDGEAQVLDELSRDGEMKRLASEAGTIIDFRARGRLSVRRDPREVPVTGPALPDPGS